MVYCVHEDNFLESIMPKAKMREKHEQGQKHHGPWKYALWMNKKPSWNHTEQNRYSVMASCISNQIIMEKWKIIIKKKTHILQLGENANRWIRCLYVQNILTNQKCISKSEKKPKQNQKQQMWKHNSKFRNTSRLTKQSMFFFNMNI